jgi:hypothetical protein
MGGGRGFGTKARKPVGVFTSLPLLLSENSFLFIALRAWTKNAFKGSWALKEIGRFLSTHPGTLKICLKGRSANAFYDRGHRPRSDAGLFLFVKRCLIHRRSTTAIARFTGQCPGGICIHFFRFALPGTSPHRLA